MRQKIVGTLDRIGRNIQNRLGSRFTECTQKCLGPNGTRFITEILGRSPRHRPQVGCNKERIGRGQNSWVICPDLLTKESVIYSLGVGKDITFDLELIHRFGLNVFAFDPTPSSIDWIKSQLVPEEFHFVECGISNFNGVAKFYAIGRVQFTMTGPLDSEDFCELQVNRMSTLMSRFGHRKIDLLKMDIEGGEYDVIEDLVSGVALGGCRQLAVEFHHRFPNIGLSKTEAAVAQLNSCGYQIFDISESGTEYSFIRP